MSRASFTTRSRWVGTTLTLALAALAALAAQPADAQWGDWVERDRGNNGTISSQFATFIDAGELVFYPYYEYYRDKNAEYKPAELGYTDNVDYFGRSEAHEGLIFLGYGFSDRFHLELEAAVITERLDKAANDASDFPSRLEQSGLGDVEAQLRYQWRKESADHAGIFGYFETVFPTQEKNSLIGTTDFEFQYGMGLVRSRSWGTTVLRVAVAYAEGSAEIGEYAFEYIRGVSDNLRLYGAVEGSEDEVELITEAQIFLRDNVKLKLNNAFGLTKKATGWAPEVGVMFVF